MGKGRAYGVEVMAKKTTGALTGWVSYSWSKSERRFDHVNNGEWFPFEYDRRHKLNVITRSRSRKNVSSTNHFQLILRLRPGTTSR